jgi:hypothetical protein
MSFLFIFLIVQRRKSKEKNRTRKRDAQNSRAMSCRNSSTFFRFFLLCRPAGRGVMFPAFDFISLLAVGQPIQETLVSQ